MMRIVFDRLLQRAPLRRFRSASAVDIFGPAWLSSERWTSLKIMSKHRSLLMIVALLFSLTLVSSETVREQLKSDSKFHLYAVIFGITVNTNSKIDGFRVAKITDPRSGTTDPVDVKIPKKFVEAARRKLAATKKYEPEFKDGRPIEFFTYLLYSPGHPEIVISDLDVSLAKQP